MSCVAHSFLSRCDVVVVFFSLLCRKKDGEVDDGWHCYHSIPSGCNNTKNKITEQQRRHRLTQLIFLVLFSLLSFSALKNSLEAHRMKNTHKAAQCRGSKTSFGIIKIRHLRLTFVRGNLKVCCYVESCQLWTFSPKALVNENVSLSSIEVGWRRS